MQILPVLRPRTIILISLKLSFSIDYSNSCLPPKCVHLSMDDTQLNYNLVPNLFRKVLQTFPRNLLSLFAVMVFGKPCNLTISLKKKTTICVAYDVFLQELYAPS